MPSECFRLGNIALADSSSGLSLELDGQVLIAASEEDDLSNLEILLKPSLCCNAAYMPWVKKGHRYRLVLNLQLDLEQSLDTADDLAEAIAIRLKHSEAWLQLHLTASSVESTKHPATSAYIITVFLDYSSRNTSGGRRVPSRLGRDVPMPDLRPPSTATELDLEEVRFSILLSRVPQPAHRSHCLGGTYQPANWESPCESMLLDDSDLDELTFDSFCSSPLEEGCGFSICDQDHQHEQDLLLFDGIVDSHSPLSSPNLKPADLWVSSSRMPSIKEMVRIVDLGLLLSIRNSPPKVPAPVTLQNRKFTTLETLAPALWIPGYLQAVSHSSVFIPTLAHAMANVRSNGANQQATTIYSNQVTGDKLDRAESSSAGKYGLDRDIALRLWHLCKLQPRCLKRPGSLSSILQPLRRCDDCHEASLTVETIGDETDCEAHEFVDQASASRTYRTSQESKSHFHRIDANPQALSSSEDAAMGTAATFGELLSPTSHMLALDHNLHPSENYNMKESLQGSWEEDLLVGDVFEHAGCLAVEDDPQTTDPEMLRI